MATADTRIDVACPDDLAPLFQWHRRDWTQGVIVAPDPMFLAMRTKIFALATRGGVPAIYNQREFVIGGGFMGCGPGIRDAYDRAALFADRTDDCVNPGDRPGDQPTRLALTIGVATARSHGITMPPSMKTLANRVAP